MQITPLDIYSNLDAIPLYQNNIYTHIFTHICTHYRHIYLHFIRFVVGMLVFYIIKT